MIEDASSDAYVIDDAAISAGLPAPRPIAPLSTATVTSRRPTFRWALPAPLDGARLEICADRACTTVIATIDAVGTSAAPPSDLPSGVVFWRLFGRAPGVMGSDPSPTWEAFVGRRSAPIDTSWGSVLDVDGNGYADLAIGAEGAESVTGRAYVHLGGPAGLATTAAATLTGPDGADGRFGHAIASAGDVNGDGFGDLVVGAFTVAGSFGRAYVHHGGPSGLETTPAVVLASADDLASFGVSVAGAGDVNGDGYADVVIGAHSAAGSRGQVQLHLGSASGISASPALTLTGPDEIPGSFGCSVSGIGDVNGDGYADVAVGAYSALDYAGRVYVHLGSATGLGTSAALTLTSPETGASFGAALASAGDVNGDGYADFIVGAQGDHSPTPPRAHVFHGSASALAAVPATTIVGGWASFGWSVASAGDMNGDGYGDIAIGAPAGEGYRGVVSLHLGGDAGISSTAALVLSGPGASGRLGKSISAADVDGDGLSDLAVGADGVSSNAGEAYVYLGRSLGVTMMPATTLVGPDGAGGFFGLSVAATSP